ncbi:MAG: hypothetical protein WC389_19985 [Lutibacter sp.]|jgi:hypothetical protein
MVTNNDGENKDQESGSNLSYDEMVQEEPEREIDPSALVLPKSISEEEEEVVGKTDIQAIVAALTPRFKNKRINELCQSAMVSRIFPDNYTDKHFLITASLIEEMSPEEDVDVVGIISQVQDALSIGFEGRGIADRLEIAGVEHDAELEKLSKDLGL